MTDSNSSIIKVQYGYIVYPFNDQVKNIFLKERIATRYVVSKDGGEIATSPQNISEDFRIFLKNRGYELIQVKKSYMCGIDEICGNRIDVNKLIDDENGDIKALLVRVRGIDDNDLDQKIQSIKAFIKSKFDVDSDKSNKFMFSKTDRC